MTLFQEKTGQTSMRRVLAFIFAIVSILLAIACTVLSVDYKLAMAVILPFVGLIIFMLFFTTWSDVASLIAKKG